MYRFKYPCALLLSALLSIPTWASSTETEYSALTRQAFDDWHKGQGSVFDLLADDAEWTVAGHSPVSGVYHTREAFMAGAVKPITSRLATPITPTVRLIIAQGAHVMVMWDGSATAVDGSRYENSYAWHLQFKDNRIIRVTAFLDTWTLAKLME